MNLESGEDLVWEIRRHRLKPGALGVWMKRSIRSDGRLLTHGLPSSLDALEGGSL
jgi:hypothetical protein